MVDLAFRIEIPSPAASELAVTLRVPTPASAHAEELARETLVLFMPTWTPGSYLIREYARHVLDVRARDSSSGESLDCHKIAKNRWAVALAKQTASVTIDYVVYCHELSVRTADVTPEHAFWNNACVLLWPTNARSASADITVRIPTSWQLLSALPITATHIALDGASQELTIHAASMDRAFDCPCLAGSPTILNWVASGVPYSIAFDGLNGIALPEGLAADLGHIAEAVAAVFGGKVPFDRYMFLCLLSQDGHGGLEHGDSTTLLHARTQLTTRKGYLEFTSLAAHELFHAWNVKRLRPREFLEIDYEAEVYTGFLWLIEGWTAYYDDLLCMRAGIFSTAEYLSALSRNCQAFLGNPGRYRTSLADSSFDAWIRLYRPDENTKNSSQNYYGNGAVVALCLDLMVRVASGSKRSLDDILRELYEACPENRGYGLEDVMTAVERNGGAGARKFLSQAVSGPLDPPIAAILARHGVAMTLKEADLPQMGMQFEPSGTVVASVLRHSAAWDCGIMPGDEIIAVQGLRVDALRWAEVFGAVARVQKVVELLICRRGAVRTILATPGRSPGVVCLEVATVSDEGTKVLRENWLGARRNHKN